MTEKKLTVRLNAMFVLSQITVSYDEFSKDVIKSTLCKENKANIAHWSPDYKVSDKSVLITKTR